MVFFCFNNYNACMRCFCKIRSILTGILLFIVHLRIGDFCSKSRQQILSKKTILSLIAVTLSALNRTRTGAGMSRQSPGESEYF